MKKYTLLSLLFLVSAALLTSTSAFGASGNSFKFSDSLKEKLLCDNYGFCDIFQFGKFQINAKINFENVDISKFNSDTCLDVAVGWFSLTTCLGDPGSSYQHGATRASMVFTGEDYYLGDNIPYLWVTLKWNSKKLTVKIKGLTGTPDIEGPILADDYMWSYDKGTYYDTDVASVSFYNGDTIFIDTTFDPINVTAKVNMKTNRKWDMDLYQVKVKGQGYNY
jgi:hypothetical protein